MYIGLAKAQYCYCALYGYTETQWVQPRIMIMVGKSTYRYVELGSWLSRRKLLLVLLP